MSDADLVALVLQGNRDRFTELVDRYLPMLRGLCASYVVDGATQQDLVQDTFVYAYEKLGALRNRDRFGAWLAKIGRSRCIDWLRKQRRERTRERIAEQDLAPAAEDGQTQVMQRELREWVRTRIAQLPAKTREAMVLCYVEGCSSKEAARFLGVRESALRKRLEYGRKLVGEKICEELGQTGSGTPDMATLRKRVLLALPAAAIPAKSGAAAGVAGAIGGVVTLKSGLIAVAVVGVAFALLSQWHRQTEQPGEAVAQAASPAQSDAEAVATASRAATASGPAEDSGAPVKADPGKTYDRFFFIRYNTVDGRTESSTLVLATVTREGFEFTDWYTRSGQWSRLWPLSTGAGKVFALTYDGDDALISIDTASGSITKIASVTRLCTGPGTLYEAIRDGDSATIRVYDCERQAYRDVIRLPRSPWMNDVQASPDNRRLAYFESERPEDTHDPNRQVLRIVDFRAKTVSSVGEPVGHVGSAISSRIYGGPPFLWLNSTTVLAVRANREDGGSFDSVERYLLSIDVDSGEMTDISALPGNFLQNVRLRPGELGERPIIDVGNVHGADLGRFLVDVDRRSLSEYDGIGGVFRLTRSDGGYTLFDNAVAISANKGNEDHAVAPDGRQIVWTEMNEIRGIHRDGSYYPMKLRYYDADYGKVREVAEGWFDLSNPGRQCWLSDEDLAREPKPAPKEEGWIPFGSEPWPTERRRKPDTRPDANDYLVLNVTTDADAYWLHEPIEVTITLTNISAGALTVSPPAVSYDHVLVIRVSSPGGSELMDRIQSHYSPEPEETVLGPGESVSATCTLELANEGRHVIEVEFRGLKGNLDPWRRGRIQAETAKFEILRSADEAVLFEEKVNRLLERATTEFESAPDLEGETRTLKQLQVMGSGIGPYLLVFTSSVEDPRFRELLLRPLIDIAYPEAMPYFAELLDYGTSDEQIAAVRGLDKLYREYKGGERDDIAQSALIHLTTAIHTPDARARLTIVGLLSRVKNDRVREAFERVVNDPEEQIRDMAARYLATYDGLDLADWLAQAAAQPEAIQYAVARSLVSQLERTWRVNNGAFPEGDWAQAARDADAMTQYRATLLAWERWARENPRSAGKLFGSAEEQ